MDDSLPFPSQVETLTPEQAEVYATLGGDLSFTRLSLLTAEVAEVLAKHKGRTLAIRVPSLSPEIARALARHRGRGLLLRGFTTLTLEAARELAVYRDILLLDDLTTVSDEVAEVLATRGDEEYGFVALRGLIKLSDRAARTLRANPNVTLPTKFAEPSGQ